MKKRERREPTQTVESSLHEASNRVALIESRQWELPRDERGLSILVSSPTQSVSVSGPWEEGQTIDGPYEVKEILGHGGMGIVYRVHHVNWNIDLAVKCVLEDKKADRDIVRAFLYEADRWIHLGLHPNLVAAYYVRKYDHHHYIFLEYVSGISLQKLLDEGRPLTFRQKLNIAIQICRGLAHCHRKGMIHRDLKPGNILVAGSGQTERFDAKLTDFGLVRQQAIRLARAQLQSVAEGPLPGWGTLPHMAPELFHDTEAVSGASDVYALGITLHELFAGRHPLGQHERQVWPEVHRQRQPEWLELPEAVGLASLLARCLGKLPDDRPTLYELTESLLVANRGEPFPVEPKETELLAGSLNNHAVSLVDLGKPDEAVEVWQEAEYVEADHPETTYNRGMLLWREGKTTDQDLLAKLRGAQANRPADWRIAYFSGLVHLERGDAEAAVEVLSDAAGRSEGSQEVRAALEKAERRLDRWGRCLKTFEGHEGAIKAVAMTPEGRLGVSASDDGTLRLWDLSAGHWLKILPEHLNQVLSVAITPDGRYALTGGLDRRIRLWDLPASRCLDPLGTQRREVKSVAITPDAQFALSGSSDKTVCLWEIATQRFLREFEGHTDDILSVSFAFPENARLAVSASVDREVRLWDLSTGRCLKILSGHQGGVSSVAVTSDGRFVLTGSWDKTLRLWELATGRCLRVFEGHEYAVHHVAITPDGRLGLSGGDDKTIRLWDLSTGRCLRTLDQEPGHVLSVALAADGLSALSGGWDRKLRLWDLSQGSVTVPLELARPRATGELIQRASRFVKLLKKAEHDFTEGHPARASAALAEARALPGRARDREALDLGSRLATRGVRKGLAAAWCVRIFEGHENQVHCVNVDSKGQLGLSGSIDMPLRLWDLSTGRCLKTFEGHGYLATSVAITPDDLFGLTACTDRTLRLWDLSTGRCRRVFKGHTDYVDSVAITPDGRFGLSGGHDRTVRLWDLLTGRCLRTLEEHEKWVTSVAITPDGRLALSVDWDQTLRSWDLATGQCLQTFEPQGGLATFLAITPDGRSALSGYWGIDSCDLSTGQLRRAFEGHSDRVRSVAISPDGRFGMSGSDDQTVRLWDTSTGRCLRTLDGHTGWVTSVAITPDGRYGLSGSEDKTLRLWEFDWEYEFPSWANWDEGAGPHLESFLTLHSPNAGVLPTDREPTEEEVTRALKRVGKPTWNDDDFQELLKKLQYCGYGWLRPEEVRRRLDKMTADWTGPRPLFGT